MKIFTATFKKHVRDILKDDRAFNAFYRDALKAMEDLVVARWARNSRPHPDVSLIPANKGSELWDDIYNAMEVDLKRKIKEDLALKVSEHFASCWQDNDCPQAEQTFGTCAYMNCS